MNKNIYFRIIFDAVIAVLAIQALWFIALPIALVCAWTFPYYLEFVVAGIIYDSLFGPISYFSFFGHIGAIATTVILVVTTFFRRIVRK